MKSKQTIRLLIGLMSITLIGLIIIQFLWIGNAIRLKEDEFNRNVNTAMLRASNALEGMYGVSYITWKLTNDSAAHDEMMACDPGLYNFMIDVSGQGKPNSPDAPDAEEHEVVLVSRTVDDSRTYAKSVIVKNELQRHTSTMAVSFNGHNGHDLVVSDNFAPPPAPPAPPKPAPPVNVFGPREDPNAKKTALIGIMANVADEYAISKMGIEQLLDSEKIHRTITKEFEKQKLPTDFEFAVYSAEGDSLLINKASTNQPFSYYAYKSALLPGNFADQKTFLLVNVPARTKYVFASIAGMMTLSLIFTAFMVGVFAFSLRVIFRQKKLSEITNDFINNMTHELKTPLATISMAADTMGLATANGNTQLVEEYTGTIKNEVKKLSRHVDRILESAVSENRSTLPKIRVNMNTLINTEVANFAPQVQQRGGTIKVNSSTGHCFVYADADLLRCALDNLLDNALKYSKEVPEIVVSLRSTATLAILGVSDKGVGINEADLGMIFEKFYRAHTGNRHDTKGFGLGLGFVKSVAENAGGKVRVESEPGKGSDFFIELPLM